MTDSLDGSAVRLVVITAPDVETAARLVRGAVEARLAACGNLLPGARSIYRWQGEVHDDAEVVALLKTTAAQLDALRDHLVAAHPYDCPEVIATDVVGGHGAYLDWVRENVG